VSGPLISLMVCTRNRADQLGLLLESITGAAANIDPATLEVIIVDNGSTDRTQPVLQQWAAAQSFSAAILHEARPGLSVARNTGLARAKAPIIAMTDDDCALAPDYFVRLAAIMADKPALAMVGGCLLLGDPEDLPVTIKTSPHPARLGREFPGGFLSGANFAFTAAAMRQLPPFDTRLGAGAPLKSAEDTDWLLFAVQRGIAVSYEPALVITHYHGRRTVAQANSLYAGYYFGNGALYAKHLGRDRRVIRWMLGDVKRALIDLVAPEADAVLGVRRRHLFKLREELRGFAAYLRHR
jgi:glycosyltransferase involved in cell wall biosynthesis